MTAADYHARLLALPYGGPTDRTWASSALAIYCEMLEKRVHFAQAAYRDGEFPWICGVAQENANGETYDPELGRQLAETLRHPVGQWFVYFAAHNPFRPRADAWIRDNAPGLRWIPDRPFGRASEMGVLRPFWEALKGREVVVIGPDHLDGLTMREVLPSPYWHWVVPPREAWKRAGDIAGMIQRASERLADPVYLIAAGSGACLTIAKAWPAVRDRATLIDIGATLDPYAGVFSRNLTRTEAWQRDVLPLNMP